jgi:hypothetical protein
MSALPAPPHDQPGVRSRSGWARRLHASLHEFGVRRRIVLVAAIGAAWVVERAGGCPGPDFGRAGGDDPAYRVTGLVARNPAQRLSARFGRSG